MIRITHFRHRCIGCNACVESNFNQWRISKKDGRSILIGSIKKKGIYHYKGPDHEFELNLTAAKNCPVKIIKLEKIK